MFLLYICIFIYVHDCLEARDLGIYLIQSLPYFWVRIPHWTWSLPMRHRDVPVSTSSVLVLQIVLQDLLILSHECWKLSPDPHAYVASTCLTKPSSLPEKPNIFVSTHFQIPCLDFLLPSVILASIWMLSSPSGSLFLSLWLILSLTYLNAVIMCDRVATGHVWLFQCHLILDK